MNTLNQIKIENVKREDWLEYVTLVEKFYSTDAVMHSIPRSFISDTFEQLLNGNQTAECLIVKIDGIAVGYALLAKCWSQEGGGNVCWIEEIFIKEEFRGKGIGAKLMNYILQNRPSARFRLEVEPENISAVKLYEKLGFEFIPYNEMLLEKRNDK